MMGAGLGALTARLINGLVADNLTAIGSVQADALTLPGDVNVVSVVPIGTGVALPSVPQPGDEVVVANLGANALNVYPSFGTTIQGSSQNTPYVLSSAAVAAFVARPGSANWVCLSSGGGAAIAPVNTVLPALTGDAVVGQILYSDTGSWSNSPTSFTYQWYKSDNTLLTGKTDDSYLCNDIDNGDAFYCIVTAANGGGSASAQSANSSAVAAIDLTSAITAFSRTSISGVTPMTWSITFGSGVFAGYMLRMSEFTNGTMLEAERLEDFHYRLTNDDLVPGANLPATLLAAGMRAVGATEWLFPTVYTTSPNGLGFLGSATDPISPTDAAVAMTWSASDHKSGMVLSNANLTIAANGTWSGARTNRGIGAGKKVYVEMTGDTYVGVADASATLSDAHLGAGGDGTATIHASEYQPFGQLYGFNGSNSAAPTAFGSGADVKGITLDTTGADPVVKYYLNNTLQGSKTLTGIGTPLFFMTTMTNGKSTTLNSGTPGGTTGFTYTPPAGFVAP